MEGVQLTTVSLTQALITKTQTLNIKAFFPSQSLLNKACKGCTVVIESTVCGAWCKFNFQLCRLSGCIFSCSECVGAQETQAGGSANCWFSCWCNVSSIQLQTEQDCTVWRLLSASRCLLHVSLLELCFLLFFVCFHSMCHYFVFYPSSPTLFLFLVSIISVLLILVLVQFLTNL